ncbi:hypothetical protein BOTNAR_0003g00220 [Botryotinia narcissicola]|uniref:Rhodopsin domain-containing protein n=1 Tax=Botryotinia narcissicola TaxID=278944 RepID=A0A4Z1J8U1_9HELO|nr:hypothetical protein BOTNAR_0003g00220 [Botryotinia narcissicola]
MYSSYSVAAATCSFVFPVLAGIAVYFRFHARRIQLIPYKADDYLILAAMLLAIVLACIVFEGSFRGSIGQPLSTLTPEQHTVLSKLSCGIVKCSVLMFYKRIFATSKFHLAANITLVAVSLWILASFFTQIFSAWPVSDWWTFGKSFDMNYGAMVTSFAAMDIFLDVLILCLPLPVIKHLQMTRTRKFQIVGIFWLGIFCVVSASVRMYYAYQLSFTASKPAVAFTPLFADDSTSSLIWGQIEPCTSIIAGCLPCLTPSFRGVRSPDSLIRSARSFRSIFSRSQPPSVTSLRRKATDEESQREYSAREWHILQQISNKQSVYTGGIETG